MILPNKRWILVRSLVPLLPTHERFVTVFGSHGTELLCKPPSQLEIFNDINHNIRHLFAVLMDESLGRTLHRRLQMDERSTKAGRNTDPVDSIISFLTAAQAGLRAAGIRYETPLDVLEYVRRRFLSVQIEHTDWYRVINSLDSQETLFFVEPPEMEEGQRLALLALLDRLGGQVVMVGDQVRPAEGGRLNRWRRRTLADTTIWLRSHGNQ